MYVNETTNSLSRLLKIGMTGQSRLQVGQHPQVWLSKHSC